MSADIAVVDYGMGNLRSVSKAIEHVAPALSVVVTSDPEVIAAAGRVVFPGQGAARDCMREIDARGLRQAIVDAARSKPFLGICMGMQVLFEHSEEGDTACLGILPGTVRRFPHEAMHDEAGDKLKVPHMGWNNVHQAIPHPLWAGIEDGARFYFVHSYFVQPDRPDAIAGFSHYPFPFSCAVATANMFAVQFHPEKSQNDGLMLLGNFVTWNPGERDTACDMSGAACA
ncbi:MAG: imidazole glycerol phosphate synthase, glutamine amidotransferase subunit [Thiobacillus sp. SCN 64-317]|uniref:imidazole glycerol phosphate synthase subunit HisH n=1 Tax=Thiobacillus sp. 63-78 TaxID=1895859 RepID=UPI00086E841B|nr:imidazole glycerol phosphate synthase subunit HisH [Thiobacillus sp. 63-78]MBN8762998.1 imidazole glycerol phosphate synthase subunit HisH [Thiobacillus sp.]MBN8774610.1 imidazole glycerol phosphate synthase subunit HisH [Thiobacillus sp.]ODV13670.1 MAG: imidazole glycerol phosphate synthase, glutamine amidotransferase subunit [Thiobacillus sp. SCN 64-317]